MKPIYIFDLDGTLANIDHRMHFIESKKKDWPSFYAACVDDKPIRSTIDILIALSAAGYDVRIWSGRSDEVMAQTKVWLMANDIPATVKLRMRRSNDFTQDDVLKERWLEDLQPDVRKRIRGVFEDRKRVVDMYRANDITVYQVAEGNF